MFNKKTKTTYRDYLFSLKKNEINSIIKSFNIDIKSSASKEKEIDAILENLNKIVKEKTLLFQNDELLNIRILIRKNGLIKVKYNYLLLNFLKNLVRHKLVIAYDNETFYMPEEILKNFKKCIKNKMILKQIKYNTKEYNLILGFLNAYGAIDINMFYKSYQKEYDLSEEAIYERLSLLKDFYQEFNIITNSKNTYLVNNGIQNFKQIKTLVNKNNDYKEFTNSDLRKLGTYQYFKNVKSYKKLQNFLSRNYYLEYASYRAINKYVLTPYLYEYELSKENADKLLSDLIDEYFEFKNKKHKEKFVLLIKDVALDYPKWDLKGHSERENIC